MSPDRITSLYLHVPFCASRCLYCDFPTSACDDDALMDAYADALAILVRRASRAGLLGNIETVYLGGGTPSHLGSSRLSSLIQLIAISTDIEEAEVTLEANPESLDERMMHDLWALGVNRWSLGVQSFDDDILRFLRRPHDARRALDDIAMLMERDANVSVDLICGIPGQSPESFQRDLDRVVELGIPHVSIYPLMVEEGTPLAALIDKSEVPPVCEDVSADMMEMAESTLSSGGLLRYEVASYARPGFESRHNSAYWTGRGYLGLGSAASSFLSPELFDALCEAGVMQRGESVPVCGKGEISAVRPRCTLGARELAERRCMRVDSETLTRREALIEETMLRMRRTGGIAHTLLATYAQEVPELAGVFEDLVRDGLAEEVDGSFVPTHRGWLAGNVMYGRIWALADVTDASDDATETHDCQRGKRL